ncbi:MAG: hypothetical protein MJ249_10985, partial [Kiritimatiellae bacterium]|nr:hypothetical protein [Kiritimatiellia bacterium]
AFAFGAMAEVDVTAILNESAMWLDASKPEYFQMNEMGGVTNWVNRSVAGRATYGDAHAYLADPAMRLYCGSVAWVNGAPAYQMFQTGSRVDLGYTRISTIRAVFIVGDFELKTSAWNPILGDHVNFDFHRGQNGEIWRSSSATTFKGTMTCYLNDITKTVDGNSAKPVVGRKNIIVMMPSANACSDQLSRDRSTYGRYVRGAFGGSFPP